MVKYTTGSTVRSAGSTPLSPTCLTRTFERRFTDHVIPTTANAIAAISVKDESAWMD